MKILAFEELIEKTYITLLKDYKYSFDNLKRPFINEEYSYFLEKKEKPLKIYFQLLKEYIFKLQTTTNVQNIKFYYLIRNYENCSICDILTTTNDFSLKFNILYLLNKDASDNLFETASVENLNSTHYQILYEFLFVYSDPLHLKFLDFHLKNRLNLIKEKPKYLAVIDNEIQFIYINDCNQVDIETRFDLEEQFLNFKKIYQNDKDENLHLNPQAFKEFLDSVIKKKYPAINIDCKILEEIKVFFFIFHCTDGNYKVNLEYFFLVCCMCENNISLSKYFINFD